MRLKGFIFAFIVVGTWSGWYIVSKLGLSKELTIWDVVFLRYVTVAVITFPILIVNWKLRKTFFNAKTFVFSLCYGLIYLSLAFSGLKISPASNSGVIINGTLPIFSSIIAFFWLSQKIGWTKRIGTLLVLIANITLLYGSPFSILGTLLLFTSSFVYSFYLVSIKHWKVSMKTIVVAVPWINFLIFSPIWFFFLPSNLFSAPVEEIVLQSFYQGIVVNFIALYLMSKAIMLIGSIPTSTILALVPSMVGIFAYIFLNETLTFNKIMALILCSIGVFICSMKDFSIASLKIFK